MTKRRLTRRQAWRIEKIQQDRIGRAQKKGSQIDRQLSEGGLGPEQKGLIIAHFGSQVEIEALEGEQKGTTQRAHMRANLASLVTGDTVVWRPGPLLADGAAEAPSSAATATGVVVARIDRHTELCRPDAQGILKPVAANIDLMVIVVAPQPPTFSAMIDRYLVAAEHQGIEPLLLLNKNDLLAPHQRDPALDRLERYAAIGYRWLRTSTQRPGELDELRGQLTNKTAVFVGQSGVGKSSLINALLPDARTRVGELSASTGKGRHTTTTARLFHFPAGGHLIDSPGVRDFGLWQMDPLDIAQGFRDFKPFLGHCKFRDCAHRSDPGCALTSAVEAGRIDPRRLRSYHNLVAALQQQLSS